MENNQKMIFAGIIMPDNWDETGRIIDIALYTMNEEVYTLEHNKLMKELMDFLHQGVEIKGKIKEYPDGRKSIVAYNYVSLKNHLIDD